VENSWFKIYVIKGIAHLNNYIFRWVPYYYWKLYKLDGFNFAFMRIIFKNAKNYNIQFHVHKLNFIFKKRIYNFLIWKLNKLKFIIFQQ
jgi:hypothetical protein